MVSFTERKKRGGIDSEVRGSEEEELTLLYLGAFGRICIELYRGDIRFILSTQCYVVALLQLLKSLSAEDALASVHLVSR